MHLITDFEVLTGVTVKNSIFLYVRPCCPVDAHKYFGETFCLPLRGRRVNRTENALSACSFFAPLALHP
jgi:hypothetical protein